MPAAGPFLQARYDSAADVLYLSLASGTKRLGRSEGDGLVWLTDLADETVGAVVPRYKALWRGREALLAERLARHLHLPTAAVLALLADGQAED